MPFGNLLRWSAPYCRLAWLSSRGVSARRPRENGQGLVDFALTMPLVFTLLMGALELGVAFNGYVTVTNAAREGARAGAIYLYDSTQPLSPTDLKAYNQQQREIDVRDAVASSLGILKATPPNFDRNTDVTISYVHDPSLPEPDSLKGDLIVVRVTYRYSLLSKVISENPVLTMSATGEATIE